VAHIPPLGRSNLVWEGRVPRVLPSLPHQWKTCEAVITETLFLFQSNSKAIDGLRKMLSESVLKLDYSANVDLEIIFREMKSYQKLPMSFADACLIRMMEREKNAVLFTLDHHFEVYRYKGRRLIPRVKI
jgi:uncharacterized protein